MAIPCDKAFIFLQRNHHHPGSTVTLDTDRVKHRLIGVISEFSGDHFGGNGENLA
jgi:hypothetical protein